MTLVDALGAWVSGVNTSSLPAPVQDQARLCLLDYVGITLRADEYGTTSTRAAARLLIEILCAEDGARDCMVLGFPQRLSMGNAALLNSFLGDATSLDDTAARSMSHPGCAVIPAVLAIAERCGSSGDDVLAAIVAGYEVMIRVGRAIMPGHAKRGFHVTAITAPFGAAAAAARLLGLDASASAAALAIAGDTGAGLQEALFRSYPVGKFALARGVQAGIMAAQLARGGMTGAPEFLEGPEGFLRAMTDSQHPDLILRDLGRDYENLAVGFKFHSGCRHWHAAVDAVVSMRKGGQFNPEEVESIHVRTYSEALRMNIDHPANGEQARLSTAFAIAQAVLGKDLITGDLFHDGELFRPEVQRLMSRVTHSLDASFEARYPAEWPVEVEVRTRDGRTLRVRMDGPLGEPENTKPEQLRDKFITMATPALGAVGARRFLSLVDTVETFPDLTPLLEVLGSATNSVH